MSKTYGYAEIFSAHKGKDLTKRVAEALGRCGITEDLISSVRIAVKPNLTYPFFKPGVTTSPWVLRAVVGALREYTSHIVIVESDGGSNAWTSAQAFVNHEVPEICKDYGVRSAGLTGLERRVAHTRVGVRDIAIELPRLLLDETDFLLTVPVPKVHAMTGVSLGFKNQWGCIPDVKRLKHHSEFTHTVLAVNKLVRARVAVFDGTTFLDRSGPMAGDPVPMNLIVAGEIGDATRVCCEIMQIDPVKIPHLKLAIEEGMMPRDLSTLQFGVDVTANSRHFRLERSALDWLSYAIFHSSIATRVCYNSALSKALHNVLYAIKGHPKDFSPQW